MANLGIQHVRPDGDDTSDGETWATGKATIEAALSALPNTWPLRGGTVYLSAGRHIAHEIDLGVQHVNIVGVGKATNVVPQGAYGFEIQAWYTKLSDFKMVIHSALGDDPFYGQAIRIVSDRNATIRDVWVNQLSNDYTGTADIDVAPAAIWIGGLTKFSDWHVIDGLSVWDCWRGIVNAGSANLSMSNCDVNTVAEGVYSIRRDISSAENMWGGDVQAVNCWFTGGNDYLIRLESDPQAPNRGSNSSFLACTFEPGASSGVDSGHIWCGQDWVRVIGAKFIGGSHSTDPSPHAVFFDDGVKDCVVTGYTRSSGGFGLPDFYGDTAAQDTLTV